jgi:nitrous oxide reductase accessory protein NosL
MERRPARSEPGSPARRHASGLRGGASIGLLLAIALSMGCPAGDNGEAPVRSDAPQSLAGSEGAVCGMVVSEQPAPRAQVEHRDGTRAFFCGITDLLVHLDVPSPHGAPIAIFVEVMEADEDPREIQLHEHDWVRAEGAVYRLGDDRPRLIMGQPVMTYRDQATAERALAHGPTQVLDWNELRFWWQEQIPHR